MKKLEFNRRAFLQTALAAAAATTGAGLACSTTGTPWRFFSVDEARTLAAICDQIIPADQDPGAAWAGVVNYIDRQLCGPFQKLQPMYRLGLSGVDDTARRMYGNIFAELNTDQQIQLLQALERGNASGEMWRRISGPEFLSLLIDHTMQGFYGDPRHGGNHEGASWKMLGLAYPPIRGRQQTKP